MSVMALPDSEWKFDNVHQWLEMFEAAAKAKSHGVSMSYLWENKVCGRNQCITTAVATRNGAVVQVDDLKPHDMSSTEERLVFLV